MKAEYMTLQDELIIKLNLQLFASPEDEGRTEEPSEKKIREAREKGKIAKTNELSAALVLFVTFLVIWILAQNILGSLLDFMRYIFTGLHQIDFTMGNFRELLTKMTMVSVNILGPPLIATVVVAFIADLVQVGFQISTEPLRPDISKISFTFEKLMQKVLFSRQVGVNLIKSVVKVLIIILISFLIIKSDFNQIVNTIDMGLTGQMKLLSWITLKIVLWNSIVMLVFSLFDYMYQRWEHMQSLRMTVPEVKEERRQLEGDPYIKARQRERFRSMALRRIIQEVPKADVIVTNPTHFAVALLYDNEYMNAPQVTAKGVDSLALRIIDIAKENHVTVMENPPLARALYKEVDIGEEIPAHLFEAVAYVLSTVYEMNKEAV
ncbi:MAG: flagellar biosynthesis protein FlhB [bacterium]|nr:flagellar biosynthesis protein FlhB [bacterium]